MNGETERVPEVLESPYGYCPVCGAKGLTRERRPNGDDRCEKGHSYPSRDSLKEKTISMRVADVFRRVIPVLFIVATLSGCD